MTSFQSYDVMLHCMHVHRLCLKTWILNQEKIESNLGVHPPYNPDLNLSPVIFGFFSKLKEQRLAGQKFTRVQDLSKPVRHFRAQCYTYPENSLPSLTACPLIIEKSNVPNGNWTLSPSNSGDKLAWPRALAQRLTH